MPAISTSQIVDMLDANLSTMYQDGLSRHPEVYPAVFNITKSDKSSEVFSYLSGFGSMPEKPQGQDASYDVVKKGVKTTITPKTYALGYEITEEAIEDNLHSTETFNVYPQALATSAHDTRETITADVFNNGFTTNGYDGVPLFSTAHVNADGATWSNRPSTNVDLSVSSLKASITAFKKFTDERGLKLPASAVRILYPPDLWDVVKELLGSEFKPYTANNEVNVLKEQNFVPIEWNYLTDTDAWFILGPKEEVKLMFVNRVPLGKLRRGTDFDSTNLKHLARMRFGVGYYHARMTYGSPGA